MKGVVTCTIQSENNFRSSVVLWRRKSYFICQCSCRALFLPAVKDVYAYGIERYCWLPLWRGMFFGWDRDLFCIFFSLCCIRLQICFYFLFNLPRQNVKKVGPCRLPVELSTLGTLRKVYNYRFNLKKYLLIQQTINRMRLWNCP